MSSHDEAGHAVGDTGSCCQEGDSHDDVRNPQCVTNDCDLEEAGRGGELRADTSATCPRRTKKQKRLQSGQSCQEATSALCIRTECKELLVQQTGVAGQGTTYSYGAHVF